MPTPHVTPPSNGTASTWQIGTYNAVTDAWTLVLDLNDRSTWFVKSYDLAQPEKVVSRSGNPRTQGERITNERYKNRYITLTLQLRSTTTLAAIDTAIHSLEAALSNTPFMLRLAEAQAAQYSYAIVKSWIHNIPQDPLQRLAMVKTSITLVLECEPFLLGDKLYLDNLVVNPGFEAPSGPTVNVFNDTFANANAYTLLAGSAPSVAANVMTIPAGTTLQFGSPVWGAINLWQIRFQWLTGAFDRFLIHTVDANNALFVQVSTGTNNFIIEQLVAGTAHVIATGTVTLTTGNWYWMSITQFPTVPGDNPYVQATLFNDNAGAVGTAVSGGALGPVATFDAVTALSGRAQLIAIGANFPVGGAFANVHTVGLFGPGAWLFSGTNGTTGLCSGAWDQSTSNTFPSGPVTSYGAMRVELAPAGTIGTYVYNSLGGSGIASSFAIPVVAVGNVMAASVWMKSSGLSANATIALWLYEYDSSGTQLRTNSLQTKTGNQASWTQLSGTLTTGANCAYVNVLLLISDTTGSNNGTVWFDNVQCYNQTTTGQTTMGYCELRFPQAPAQLMVSGLVGDVPTPATLAFGTYFGNTSLSNAPYTFLIGRRSYATSGVQLAAPLTNPNVSSGVGAIPVLDSTSHGGLYIKWTAPNSGSVFPTYLFSGRPADYQGVAALFVRMYSSETAGTNISKVTINASSATQNLAWNQALVNNGIVYDTYVTQSVAGLTAQNTWTLVNAGILPIPSFARSNATDLTQNYQGVGINLADTNATATAMRINWGMLLPNDGGTLRGQVQYTGNTNAASNAWNWYYIDASPAQGGLVPITAFSYETVPLANITHAAGGVGVPPPSVPDATVSIIPTGDPYLTLDPQPPTNALSVSGVNQFAALLTDSSNNVINFVASLSYTPRYLDPR